MGYLISVFPSLLCSSSHSNPRAICVDLFLIIVLKDSLQPESFFLRAFESVKGSRSQRAWEGP